MGENNKPNKELFESYCASLKKVTLPVGFNGGFLTALFYHALFSLTKHILYRKIKPSDFDYYNNMTVSVVNDGWKCPCCKIENLGTSHCERCGVLPKFIEED